MGIEKPKEYKDPKQLDIDFGGDIVEGERAQIIKELNIIEPDFDPSHLVEENGEWKILFRNKKFSIDEWKEQKNFDKLYEKDPNDNLFQK